MKYSWKGHKDRNGHKNRIKRSGQACLVYIKGMNHNIPTTWREPAGIESSQPQRIKSGLRSLKELTFLKYVPAGSPSRGANVAIYVFDKNQPSLPTPFYSVLVSVSVFVALSTAFHSMNSPDNSPLSHSVLPVLFLPYCSFQLYIYIYIFMKVSFSPDIIICGWLGLKHQLTNKLIIIIIIEWVFHL